MTWSAAKEILVAMIRVGVGPGVKMELKRSVRKAAMSVLNAAVETIRAPSQNLRLAVQSIFRPGVSLF